VRLLFAGTPEPAVPSLRALLDSPRHDVVAVLTRPDAPAARGRTVQRSPVGALADEAGIPVLTPRRPSEPEFLAALAELAPDCAPVVAYGALVPRAALDIPAHGWVNLHFSLLPAWRGAAPVQAAIRHGDDVTGATTFRLEEGLDTGPTVTAVPQPVDGISLAPKVTVADARVDWSVPAGATDRLVRSVTPEPGAWTTFREQRLGLGPVRPVRTGELTLAPGALHVEKKRVLVGTATVPVELGEVRPVGKKAMSAPDWARGVRISDGEGVQ